MMLDLKLCTELGDHSIIEVGTVICDNSFWDTILTDKIMSDEPCHNVLVTEENEAASTHFVK